MVYPIDDPNGNQTHFIKEDNPWVKVGDVLFGQIPFLGILGGFVFHPSYTCYVGGNYEDKSQPVMAIKKEPGFFEGLYTINLVDQNVRQIDEVRTLLSFMLMVQFMRRRG